MVTAYSYSELGDVLRQQYAQAQGQTKFSDLSLRQRRQFNRQLKSKNTRLELARQYNINYDPPARFGTPQVTEVQRKSQVVRNEQGQVVATLEQPQQSYEERVNAARRQRADTELRQRIARKFLSRGGREQVQPTILYPVQVGLGGETLTQPQTYMRTEFRQVSFSQQEQQNTSLLTKPIPIQRVSKADRFISKYTKPTINKLFDLEFKGYTDFAKNNKLYMFLQGAGKEAVSEVAQRPVRTAAIVGVSYGLGIAGGALARSSSMLVRTAPAGISKGLVTTYLASKGVEVYATKGAEQRGRVVGRAVPEITAFATGARFAGKTNIKAANKAVNKHIEIKDGQVTVNTVRIIQRRMALRKSDKALKGLPFKLKDASGRIPGFDTHPLAPSSRQAVLSAGQPKYDPFKAFSGSYIPKSHMQIGRMVGQLDLGVFKIQRPLQLKALNTLKAYGTLQQGRANKPFYQRQLTEFVMPKISRPITKPDRLLTFKSEKGKISLRMGKRAELRLQTETLSRGFRNLQQQYRLRLTKSGKETRITRGITTTKFKDALPVAITTKSLIPRQRRKQLYSNILNQKQFRDSSRALDLGQAQKQKVAVSPISKQKIATDQSTKPISISESVFKFKQPTPRPIPIPRQPRPRRPQRPTIPDTPIPPFSFSFGDEPINPTSPRARGSRGFLYSADITSIAFNKSVAKIPKIAKFTGLEARPIVRRKRKRGIFNL